MTNYKVKYVAGNTLPWEVVEVPTENIMKTYISYKDAKAFTQNMNKNLLGFQGWTPNFFFAECSIENN